MTTMENRSLICVVYRGQFVIEQYTHSDGYPSYVGVKVLRFISDPANIARLKKGLEHTQNIEDKELLKICSEIEKLENWKKKTYSSSIVQEQFKKGESMDLPVQDMSDMSQDQVNRFTEWKKKVLEFFMIIKGDMMGHGFNMTTALMEFWPELSRETGPGILERAASATAEKPLLIRRDLQLALHDSAWEWIYVLDLDEDKLEIFEGVVPKEDSVSTRFNDIEPNNKTLIVAKTMKESITVPKYVKSFGFSELPFDENEFVSIIEDIVERSRPNEPEVRDARPDGPTTTGVPLYRVDEEESEDESE